jgi:phage recombination protein Bet
MSNEIAQVSKPSLLAKFSERYAVDANKMLDTLKSTAFRQSNGQAPSNEQMMALLVVADQYQLNPFTKEIYAFPDKGGIVPVVGVDGWSRIINSNPEFDGMDFEQDAESCTCIIYRKDRNHPIKVTEWMAECKRNAGPWQSHPRRMLRHKAMIQCARIAFGFVGIYDQDEAERITERDMGQAVVVDDKQVEFEAEHLPALRDASLEGPEALLAAFNKIPAGAEKNQLWKAHGPSLKKASDLAAAEPVGGDE